jgi:hypothetical protein
MANINDRQLYKVDKCIFLVDKSVFCTFNKSNNKTTIAFCLSYVFFLLNPPCFIIYLALGDKRGKNNLVPPL